HQFRDIPASLRLGSRALAVARRLTDVRIRRGDRDASWPAQLMTGRQHFERRYQTEEEPWRYGARAAELLRHDWIVRTVGELAPRRGRTPGVDRRDSSCGSGRRTGLVHRARTGRTLRAVHR